MSKFTLCGPALSVMAADVPWQMVLFQDMKPRIWQILSSPGCFLHTEERVLPQQDHVACQLLADFSGLVAPSPGREAFWPRGIEIAGPNCRSLEMRPGVPERGPVMLPGGSQLRLGTRWACTSKCISYCWLFLMQTLRLVMQQSGKQSGKPPSVPSPIRRIPFCPWNLHWALQLFQSQKHLCSSGPLLKTRKRTSVA